MVAEQTEGKFVSIAILIFQKTQKMSTCGRWSVVCVQFDTSRKLFQHAHLSPSNCSLNFSLDEEVENEEEEAGNATVARSSMTHYIPLSEKYIKIHSSLDTSFRAK